MPRTPRAVQTPGQEPAAPDNQAAAPAEAAPAAVDESGLPDASEIDPNKIRRAVLTKQGWVCPAKLPGLPARE